MVVKFLYNLWLYTLLTYDKLMKKLFSIFGFVNVAGMSLAFASLYMLLVQLVYDVGYNKYGIKDVENIYVLTMKNSFDHSKYTAYLSRAIPWRAINTSSVVKSGGPAKLLNKDNGTTSIFLQNGEVNNEFQAVVSDFTISALDVFSFEFVSGDKNSLKEPGTIAISERMARELDLNIGDIVSLKPENQEIVTVTCIFENFPKASDLGEIDVIKCSKFENHDVSDMRLWNYTHFVKLDSPESVKDFETHAAHVAMDMLWNFWELESLSDEERKEHISMRNIHLVPFKDLYFTRELSQSVGKKGNPLTTFTLFILCVVIIVITITNFINSVFAQVPRRIRAVNTQKILGASRGNIVSAFLSEAALMVLVSIVFAGVIVYFVQGSNIANFISRELGFASNISVIILTTFIALIVTLIAGIYPARYITSFPPAFALKGMSNVGRTGMNLRYTLQCVQFTASIILIICTMFLIMQNRYMISYDMGFNKENLFIAEIPDSITETKQEDFSNKLLSHPQIKDLAWSQGPFLSVSKAMQYDEIEGERIQFDILPVSYNFLDFMGIGIVEGRNFQKSDENSVDGVYIFNKKAKVDLGINPQLKIIGHRNWTDVAGICEDCQYKPLQYGVEPIGFYVYGRTPWKQLNNLYIRAHDGVKSKDVMAIIEETAASFDNNPHRTPVDTQSYEDSLGSLYKQEIQLSRLIAMFAVIAISISLLGVIGLVMYESLSKIKEISVRRVLGAEVSTILRMFNTRFMVIITICFMVAAPISYYVMSEYLSTFTDRIPMYWWIFALTYVLMLGVSSTIVSLSCLKAVKANPVEGLKVEN